MNRTYSFTRAEWNTYAQCYDALTLLRPYEEMIANVISLVPPTAESILDLGCGTGTLLSQLAKRSGAQLTGVDDSPQMLSLAQKKLGEGATLLRKNLERQSDWGGPYDCVISTNVLYTIHNPLSFLSRVRQITAPSGTVIIVTPKIGYDNGLILKAHCQDRRDNDFWRDPHRSPMRERMLIKEALGDSPLAADMGHIAEHNRRIAHTHAFHFYSEAELSTLVGHAGLRVVHMDMTYADQNFLLVATRE
ncbi:MAG: class I SAM-dependent methyltransferase [Patescibacteria group bacterium]